jgi:DnaJ C terminal domain
VLDAVDLSQLEVPSSAMQAETRVQTETKDGQNFRDILGQFFGIPTFKSDQRGNLDSELQINVSKALAESGGEQTVSGPRGQLRVRLPAGTTTGTRLRIRGQGRQEGSITGDLYIKVIVDP